MDSTIAGSATTPTARSKAWLSTAWVATPTSGLPARVDLLERYIREYRADGFIINSVKSCNSFSVGQLLMLRQLEQRTGVPGGFIESDLVDPRYFSSANIKNRIESYIQMLAQRRAEVTA